MHKLFKIQQNRLLNFLYSTQGDNKYRDNRYHSNVNIQEANVLLISMQIEFKEKMLKFVDEVKEVDPKNKDRLNVCQELKDKLISKKL